tara:strand:- start:330 stop:1157 length:828 start_codon:yes stop_codon:yes gene_type:complete
MRFFGLNIWQLMMKIDGLILSLLNIIIRINDFFRIKQKKLRSSNNVNIGKKRDIFIVLNGPSIVNQDLTTLKNKSIMFVNRGFLHHEYKRLQPEFHVFADTKMLTGEWSISWIDEIITMVPTITFIMPAKWAFHEKLKPYINKGVKIHWMTSKFSMSSLGVSGLCFEFCIEQNFKTIFFTGFDANGIGHELAESSRSHFYGQNKENLQKTTLDYAQDLYMHSRFFISVNQFTKYASKKKVSIINLTAGGLLDMFPRMDLSKIIEDVEEKISTKDY